MHSNYTTCLYICVIIQTKSRSHERSDEVTKSRSYDVIKCGSDSPTVNGRDFFSYQCSGHGSFSTA